MATNYWLRSGAYTMMQRIGTFIFGFASYLLLIRYFSVDDFGVWTLYVVVSGGFEISRSSFIQNAFLKFYNETTANKSELFTSSLVLNALSTVLFVTLLILLIPVLQIFWSSSAIGVLLLWYCATAVLLIPFTQLNYLEQANHHFKGVFWSSLVRQATFFAIVSVCFFFVPGKTLAFFAGAQTFAALFGLLTAYTMSRSMLPPTFLLNWGLVGKLFKFGRFILGTGITSTVGKNADQVILGAVSHEMVAIYNSGVRVLNFIEIPTLSVSSIVYPKIAAKASAEGNEAVGKLYEKSVATILGIILPVVIFVFIFPEFVLTVIAGERYVTAAVPLRIMAAASIFLPFNVQVGSACEVINRPQVSFYINLVANVLNVLINIVLIKMFGILGASVAFLFTVFLIFVLGQSYLRSKLSVRLFRIILGIPEFYRNAGSMLLKGIQQKNFNV